MNPSLQEKNVELMKIYAFGHVAHGSDFPKQWNQNIIMTCNVVSYLLPLIKERDEYLLVHRLNYKCTMIDQFSGGLVG